MNSAHAEYRAFELVITNGGQERVVISSLDPRQYRLYYPLRREDRVWYRKTWMCRGNTGEFKRICPAPADPNAPAPSTETQPKS